MTKIDYKKVKCPKCGKSYFSVKENSRLGITDLIFHFKPDPIYRNGELQNPAEAELQKEYCKCLECGCNFRVEFIDFSGEYKFIDEDAESEEHLKKIKEHMKVREQDLDLKQSLETYTPLQVIGDSAKIGGCTLKNSESNFVKLESTETTHAPIKWENSLKDELDEIKERLERLEKKESL